MDKIVFDSVDTYNRLYSQRTLHPLISVVDLKQCASVPNNIEVKFEVYAIFLKNVSYCSARYGRRKYDFQSGTVVSFCPGQVIEFSIPEEEKYPDVVGVVFHPDLIYRTPLAEKIQDFSFLNYSELESLHLSDKEKEKFNFCLDLIRQEAENPIDSHSASVLSANIQLLLEHLDRFYDRQFITRHKVNSEIVSQFHHNLKQYFSEEKVSSTPNVGYFAELASLSPGYFSDLIKKETGSSPKDLISLHIISEAKRRLLKGFDDISTIAYDLGFEYPAHFTRMFKRITGLTPTEYRLKPN